MKTRTKPWLDNFTTGDEEKKAAIAAMDGGYLSLFEGSHQPEAPFSFYGGPWVQRLEAAWSEYYGVPHCVSMNSATSGLYAAIGALGVGFGDEVIVSPYTMAACATAPLVYGAIPIFADVEEDTGSLCPKSIESRITPRTKAILVVHQFGIPADMDSIMALAKKHGLKVIEDCAQAHGARYKGRLVGTIGDIGVFSLNVNKTIQSGEGGVCTTKDADLAYRLALIRNHGEAVAGPAGYKDLENVFGFNFRLTEVQAAIAFEQLRKLDGLNEIRMDLVNHLSQGLEQFPFLDFFPGRRDCESTYYVFPVRYTGASVTRDTFFKAVGEEGVPFALGYVRPLYLQPMFQEKKAFKKGYPWSAKENLECQTNYHKGACPVTEALYFNQLAINEHVRHPHTREDMDDILAAIGKVARQLKL